MKKTLLILMTCGLFLGVNAQKEERSAPLSKNEELNKAYCRGLFRHADGFYFDMMDPKVAAGSAGFQNILDFLDGRAPAVTIKKEKDFVRIPYIRNTRATIFVNEIPIDPGALTSIPITDVAMIKIIRGPFAGTSGTSGGGAIAIYTVNSDTED
ncbi:hypothetical protein JMG10_35720 [Nostoc ellipsosporum NOK]|jgi:hypothetical protein|nr:hypothetical protein [Nostoc ellipsosporum NOK]